MVPCRSYSGNLVSRTILPMASRTTKQKRRSLIIAGIALLVVAALLYAFRDELTPPPDNTQFKGAGYSFMYPREYRLSEYSRNAVSLGERDGDMVTPLVDVVIYRNDRDSAVPPSYMAFVEQQAQFLCGTDSGVESVTCGQITTATTTTANGHVGQRLSMTLTRTNLTTGTTTVGAFEPIYVFNVGASDSPSPTGPRYKALFIYPTLATVLDGTVNQDLLQLVIDTIEGEEVPLQATAAPAATQQ